MERPQAGGWFVVAGEEAEALALPNSSWLRP